MSRQVPTARSWSPGSEDSQVEGARQDEARKVWPYVLVCFNTLIRCYPFFALVWQLQTVKVDLYEPCNDGCVFLRYFGTPDAPSTKRQHMKNVARVENATFNCAPIMSSNYDILPRIVLLRNGGATYSVSLWESYASQSDASSVLLKIFNSAFMISGYPVLLIIGWLDNRFFSPEDAQYPSPTCKQNFIPRTQAQMQEYCKSDAARQKIANTLESSYHSCRIYLLSVVGWAIFKIFHDWAVLGRWTRECRSLSLAMASAFCQACACVSGFMWCLGVAEVFMANDDNQSCACYYQFPPLPMLLAFLPPASLFYLTSRKIGVLALSLQHGDALHSQYYLVPFRVVRAVQKTHPMAEFIGSGFPGVADSDRRPLRSYKRKFDKRGKRIMAQSLLYFYQGWNVLCWTVIGPVCCGPLFMRLLIILIPFSFPIPGKGGAEDQLAIIWWVVFLAITATPLVVIWEGWSNHWARWGQQSQSIPTGGSRWWWCPVNARRILRIAFDLNLLFLPVVLYRALVEDTNQNDVDAFMPHIWSWIAGGSYLFNFFRSIYRRLFWSPIRKSLDMRLLEPKRGTELDDWIKLKEDYPEWDLDRDLSNLQYESEESVQEGSDNEQLHRVDADHGELPTRRDRRNSSTRRISTPYDLDDKCREIVHDRSVSYMTDEEEESMWRF